MKVVKFDKIEDCFDGSQVKELFLDEPISKEFIRHLGVLGKLQYFPDFARPFFKVDSPSRFSVKGVEGNQTMRIVLYKGEIENELQNFTNYVELFLPSHATAPD